jgi:hypothetical protein
MTTAEQLEAARKANHDGMRRLLKEMPARRYLGDMSHGQFWELRQSGLIPTIHVGRSIYFDRADLDRFIDSIREKRT